MYDTYLFWKFYPTVEGKNQDFREEKIMIV